MQRKVCVSCLKKFRKMCKNTLHLREKMVCCSYIPFKPVDVNVLRSVENATVTILRVLQDGMHWQFIMKLLKRQS